MADRSFHSAQTQGVRHVDIPFVIVPNGSGTPTVGEGDTKQSYVTVARTGTGTFTITTKNPYTAIVYKDCQVSLATPSPLTLVCFGLPTVAAGIWTIPFTIFTSGSAADIAAVAGNQLEIWLRFRNTSVTP